MSVQILYDNDRDQAVLVCNTTDTAFGPVFNEISKNHGWTAGEVAENFLRWIPLDARRYLSIELADAVAKFVAAEPRECYGHACERPATKYDFDGLPNAAYDREAPFCSEECRDAAAEDGDERNRADFYGGSGNVTVMDQYRAAADEKRRLG